MCLANSMRMLYSTEEEDLANLGVYVGLSWVTYAELPHASPASPYSSTGIALSVAAGRVAFAFDARGPAISVDTACSSSLVCVHLARAQAGATETPSSALVHGVNLFLTPGVTQMYGAASMLSWSGRCKALDADADGYVRAEACGTLFLDTSADDDMRDMLMIRAIAGTAVNQDGRSSALTAPHGPSQQNVLVAALLNARTGGDCVAALQMHGTGTREGT